MYQPFRGRIITHKQHNQKMCKCWVKWLKRTALKGKMAYEDNTKEHSIMSRTWDIDFKNLEMYILVLLLN